MEKFINLFEEYVMKAVTMTEDALSRDLDHGTDFESFTANRARLFAILDQISQQIPWNDVAPERRDDLNRRIEYIKKLDEKLLVKLQEYRIEVKRELEATHKQKENIKAYNLHDNK